MIKENREYVIGDYRFSSFNEYREAQEDLRKIEAINKELDVHDPEVAIRLYHRIREGKIRFSSPIGEDFYKHVADILADKSVNLLDTKAIVEGATAKTKKQRRLGFAIVALAVVLLVSFGWSQVGDIISTRQKEKLAAQKETEEQQGKDRIKIAEANAKALEAASTDADNPFAPKEAIDEGSLTILPEYESLHKENDNLVGWITIPDTVVDYPVLQTQDNEYYLNRDFNKKEDSNGSIFMDYRSDEVNTTTNTIIYGHNMNNGQMFGGLRKYLEEDYFKDHTTVKFNTIYEEREYEIVAACLSHVASQTDKNFRYYNFIAAENEAQWQAFVDNINALSVFSNDVDLKAGDEVLTLSTCNNYTEDGRLFLVAKRKK